jgi:hypothetical protein
MLFLHIRYRRLSPPPSSSLVPSPSLLHDLCKCFCVRRSLGLQYVHGESSIEFRAEYVIFLANLADKAKAPR